MVEIGFMNALVLNCDFNSLFSRFLIFLNRSGLGKFGRVALKKHITDIWGFICEKGKKSELDKQGISTFPLLPPSLLSVSL